MRVYRVFERKHQATAFSGEGARRYGGRWNSVGTPMIYTSATFALALLEIIVNATGTKIPPDVVYAPLDIPDDLRIDVLEVSALPANWFTYPAPPECQQAGDAWIARGQTVAFAVPSAIVRIENNVLLNPAHRDFARIRIGRIEPMPVDQRLT